jgi:hypothetical protein
LDRSCLVEDDACEMLAGNLCLRSASGTRLRLVCQRLVCQRLRHRVQPNRLNEINKTGIRVKGTKAPAGASRVRARAAFGSAVRSRPEMTLSRLERACHGKQAGTGSTRRPELARRFSSQTGGRCCLLFGPSGPRSLPGPPARCYGWHQRSQRYCVYCAVAHGAERQKPAQKPDLFWPKRAISTQVSAPASSAIRRSSRHPIERRPSCRVGVGSENEQ